ncbi:hypothetical protein V6U71_04900 [Sphingopyxis sp. J-6]|uniref:hypothetical protein n=1 Tax=Sphingopyxis sp. J-6 TaxID=3122054 RepID=UPI00398416C5
MSDQGGIIEKLIESMQSPYDWAVAGLSGVAAAGVEGYFNLLHPVFFTEPTVGICAAILALSFKRAGTQVRSDRRLSKDMESVRRYLGNLIDEVSDPKLQESLSLDLRLARSDPAQLQAVRSRVEQVIAARMSAPSDVAVKGKRTTGARQR